MKRYDLTVLRTIQEIKFFKVIAAFLKVEYFEENYIHPVHGKMNEYKNITQVATDKEHSIISLYIQNEKRV